MGNSFAVLAFIFIALFNISNASALNDGSAFTAIQADHLTYAPEEGHDQFRAAFNSARQSIDMVMYRLTNSGDVNSILAARQRGVAIRIIVDQKGVSGNSALRAFTALQNAGVQIMKSSSAFSITHEKAAVFDGTYAVVSSINLTNSELYSRDFGILTFDPQVIHEMQTVFEADWNNTQSNGKLTPFLAVAKLVWSPINSEEKILALINSARKSLVVEVENLGDRDIIAALKKKAQAGVSVVVMAPACLPGDDVNFWKRNVPLLQDLEAGGVVALGNVPPYSGNRPYIHAKSIVADNSWYYVGSQNFSYNSLTLARELGLIDYNPSISAQISKVMQFDFSLGQKASTLNDLDCSTAWDFMKPKQ